MPRHGEATASGQYLTDAPLSDWMRRKDPRFKL